MFQIPSEEVTPLTEKPSLDYAINAIKTVLNDSPSVPVNSEEATKFLEALTNSVFAWEICNELLSAKAGLVVSYIAANTLRQKISKDFSELPLECYSSLKETIMNHLQATDDYAIQGQLSMAIADLTILMSGWNNPIEDLSTQLRLEIGLMSVSQTNNPQAILTVLNNRLIFAYIMHHMCDLNHNQTERPTRVGARRRSEYEEYLISKCDQAISWWLTTLKEADDLRAYIHSGVLTNINNVPEHEQLAWHKCITILDKLTGQIYLCYSAWLRIFLDENINESLPLINSAFKQLSNEKYIESIQDYAAEAIDVTADYCQDSDEMNFLVDHLVAQIYALEEPFKRAISDNETDKLSNFIKVITSVAEAACMTHVIEKHDFRLVELLLYCLMSNNHKNYELAERTYPFWWALLEHIQNRLKRNQHGPFIGIVNRFIMLLLGLCQFEEDEESVLPLDEDIHGFRADSAELIMNLAYVTSVENLIRDNGVLDNLSCELSKIPWIKNEAILFMVSCLVQLMTRDENQLKKEIFERTLCQQTNTQDLGHLIMTKQVVLRVGNAAGEVHPQIVATTLRIISLMEDFLSETPDHLILAINYILSAISIEKYRSQLIKPAASALYNILGTHASRHLSSCPQLLVIIKDLCSNLDQFDEAAGNDLLRCAALMADAIKDDSLKDQFLCELLSPIMSSLKATIIPPKRDEAEPIKNLDRLSSVFRQLNIHPSAVPKLTNFVTLVDTELWALILKVLEIYAAEKGHAIERTCRTIRYLVRCIKPEWMIERIAETMINLYKTYPQNSSPLYICSILVDEFANRSPEINQGLFTMLEIFCTLTFTLLNMSASQSKSLLTMKNYPETIDDMMRLFNRFLKKCPSDFVNCKALESIIELSISSLRIDHHDANTNVSKFVTSFIAIGQNPDYSRIGDAIRNVLGARITDAVIKACLFDIPSFLVGEEAQILMALYSFDKELFSKWVEASISTLPKTIRQGADTVTSTQLHEFRNSLTSAGSLKRMVNSLRAHSNMYS